MTNDDDMELPPDWLKETIAWVKKYRADINPEEIMFLAESGRMHDAISLLMSMAFHAGIEYQKNKKS